MTTVTKVPLLDLTRFEDGLREELVSAFESVLDSGRYIMGPEVTSLEAEAAEYVGAKHAIGVSSGSDALLAALMALGIGDGDEVICPTYTFFATAGAVWRVGAKPVFVDSDPATYNCLPEQVAAAITERTKAIIPVHLFGQSADMDPLLKLGADKGIPVIEDAAQAIGTRYAGKPAGSMGDYACFSFFPSKNLGCLGDGGLVTTCDDDLAEKLRIMRAHGGKPKYYHHVVGGNFRIDALQAALIRIKLRRLEKAHAARNENAAFYDEAFASSGVVSEAPAPELPRGKISLPVRREENHIFNQYVIRVGGPGRRDALRAALAERGIGSEVYYPVPMHLQKCFAALGHAEGDFPIAELAAEQSLAIPVFPELSRAELEYVAAQLCEALAE